MRRNDTAVLMPNYNYGKYISDSLAGIANQTVKPTEIVIVDDGSSDDSVEQICKLIDAVPDVYNCTGDYTGILGDIPCRFIANKENKGPSHARNTGLKYILNNHRYKVVALCDSDDVYHPTKIEESIKVFEHIPHCGLVYSDYSTLNTMTGEEAIEYKEPFDYHKLLYNNIVSTNSVVLCDAIKAVGMYDESLRVAEDYDLWLRIAEKYLLYHIAEPLFTYKVTGEGATFSVDKTVWNQCLYRIRQKIVERSRGT